MYSPNSSGWEGADLAASPVAVRALAAAPLPGGGQLLAACLADGAVQVLHHNTKPPLKGDLNQTSFHTKSRQLSLFGCQNGRFPLPHRQLENRL